MVPWGLIELLSIFFPKADSKEEWGRKIGNSNEMCLICEKDGKVN